jgi:tetratricopeptide (TPR) repeat protein
VDEAYLAREHVPAQYDDNYAHNLSYLVAACAETGRRQEALNWAKKLEGLPASLAYAASALNYAIPVGSATLRLHLRFADFGAAAHDAINFGDGPAGVDASAKDYQQGLHLYAQGMARLAEGSTEADIKEAQQDSEELQGLVNALGGQASRSPAAMSGMASPMSGMISFWTGGAAHLLEVSSVELQGVLKCTEGDNAEGFALLKDAVKKEHALGYTEPPYYARPVEESLGDAYLRAHAWELAREAFNQELQVRPKSGFALYGIARSYELQGRAKEATHAYEEFLAAWQRADQDLPQVRTARDWVAMRTKH